MPKSATLTLAWDGQRLLCEAPGPNGARHKVDVLFSELPAEMQASLIDQHDAIRRRERAALHQQKLDNMQYVAQTHGPILAEALYGELKFSQALNRFHLAQRAAPAKPAGVMAEDVEV